MDSGGRSISAALLGGAVAGTAVDLVLFPLDTIKTRLQSQHGFKRSGGFSRIYAGLASSMVGSAPNAALFFGTYETTKYMMSSVLPTRLDFIAHMSAASLGEVVACLIRVPVEVVKQRTQASRTTSWVTLQKTLYSEGFLGLYRGYFTTVLREIPFSLIQFPLWEHLKSSWGLSQGSQIEPWQATICGAIAGGVAAFATTPLDVAKTRIILADKGSKMASGHVLLALKHIWKERGIVGLFAGVLPRVLWISLGGAIFLGGYEKTVQLINEMSIDS